MKKLKQAAGVIVLLGGVGLFVSASSCGGDTPATIADNNVAGSAGAGTGGAAGTESGGATGTGGSAGSSDDASVGSGGASTDLDATIFVDHLVDPPDGAFSTGDATLDDDGGNEPPVEDAGSVSSDGGVIAKRFLIYCGAKSCSGPVADCCYDSDTSTGTCSTSRCATTTGTLQCDGPEDCDVGQVCCASVSTAIKTVGSPNHEYFTHCASSCGTGAVQINTAYAVVCKRVSDCGISRVGETCKAVVNMPKGLGICSNDLRTLTAP